MEKSWQGYITALGNQKKPASNIDQGFPNTEGNTVSTGFVEWKTPNPQIQARYDAMSSSWLGVQASEAAAATSIYKPSFMSVEKK
jgi:hypothetical protein